jgi:phosphoribosylglycinamide formyltransferase 1
VNKRWALFISGRGSNAQAVMDLAESVNISLVVSSKANAWGVARARRQGIPVIILSNSINWNDLSAELQKRGINRIFLLGFMKLLPGTFVDFWQGRIWNLHPSLLPQYPGLHSIERSYNEKADMGITIHDVTQEMDAGKKRIQLKTLEASKTSRLSLERAQQLISRDEQRAVRYFIGKELRC